MKNLYIKYFNIKAKEYKKWKFKLSMFNAKGTHLKVLHITYQSVFPNTVIYDDNYGFQWEFRCRQLCGIASNRSRIVWNCAELRVNNMAAIALETLMIIEKNCNTITVLNWSKGFTMKKQSVNWFYFMLVL